MPSRFIICMPKLSSSKFRIRINHYWGNRIIRIRISTSIWRIRIRRSTPIRGIRIRTTSSIKRIYLRQNRSLSHVYPISSGDGSSGNSLDDSSSNVSSISSDSSSRTISSDSELGGIQVWHAIYRLGKHEL